MKTASTFNFIVKMPIPRCSIHRLIDKALKSMSRKSADTLRFHSPPIQYKIDEAPRDQLILLQRHRPLLGFLHLANNNMTSVSLNMSALPSESFHLWEKTSVCFLPLSSLSFGNFIPIKDIKDLCCPEFPLKTQVFSLRCHI